MGYIKRRLSLGEDLCLGVFSLEFFFPITDMENLKYERNIFCFCFSFWSMYSYLFWELVTLLAGGERFLFWRALLRFCTWIPMLSSEFRQFVSYLKMSN